MMTLKEIEKEINEIKKRNSRVEENKAWETSTSRKLLLLGLTYCSIGIYLSVIRVKDPWVHAIVPAVGFLLSTMTLSFFKELWIHHKKKQ